MKPKSRLDANAILLLVMLCASWGLQQVAIKAALPVVPPLFQAAIRSIGASLLVFIWLVLTGKRVLAADGTLLWGMAAGLLFAGEFLLVYWGLVYTHAARATIFLNTSPFIVALGAHFWIPSERIQWHQVVGLTAAFGGIVVAFSESLGMPSGRLLIGDAMLLGAAVFWGATTVLVKASPLSRIHPGKTLLYQLVVSSAVLPVGSVVLGEPAVGAITGMVAGCLVFQTVWVAGITYLIWFWLIRHYPASRLASYTFLAPHFGVLAGGLILGEPLTGRLWIALMLVGLGIHLVNRPVPVADNV